MLLFKSDKDFNQMKKLSELLNTSQVHCKSYHCGYVIDSKNHSDYDFFRVIIEFNGRHMEKDYKVPVNYRKLDDNYEAIIDGYDMIYKHIHSGYTKSRTDAIEANWLCPKQPGCSEVIFDLFADAVCADNLSFEKWSEQYSIASDTTESVFEFERFKRMKHELIGFFGDEEYNKIAEAVREIL